jgi:hypothetical protein
MMTKAFDEKNWRRRLLLATTGTELVALANELPQPDLANAADIARSLNLILEYTFLLAEENGYFMIWLGDFTRHRAVQNLKNIAKAWENLSAALEQKSSFETVPKQHRASE